MKFLPSLLIVVLAIGTGLPALGQVPPAYLVLPAPPTHAPRRAVPASPRGPITTVTRPTYAYGWFGAAPRRHWSRHTGYYGNYRQWSAR